MNLNQIEDFVSGDAMRDEKQEEEGITCEGCDEVREDTNDMSGMDLCSDCFHDAGY